MDLPVKPLLELVEEKETIEVLILPRFFCSHCFHELTLLADMMIVFCSSPFCHQFEMKVSITPELRRITI